MFFPGVDPSHFAPLFNGLGILFAGMAAIWTTASVFLNRHHIFDYLKSKREMTREIQLWKWRSTTATARAFAAEQRAVNWESGAEGAAFNQREVLSRLEEVEKRAKRAEQMIPRFEALLRFTKKLIEHTNYLEQQLTKAGVQIESVTPPIPDILKGDF